MNKIDLMVALKINEYYPNNCRMMSVQDENTGMFSAALCVYENDSLGDTLFSLDSYTFKEEEHAIMYLNRLVTVSQEPIKIMSN